MVGEHLTARARRIVTGLDDAGTSVIVSDGLTPVFGPTVGLSVNQTWQFAAVPPHVDDPDGSGEGVTVEPPPGSFIHIVTTFAPDAEWDREHQFAETFAAHGGDTSEVEASAIPGLHQTDTVDIITVISGELYCVMEEGETLLRQGDSVVMRGVKHAWSNRSDRPCTIVAVMVGATR